MDEVKQSLAGERGLSPRNRDLVMEVLGRLADRVQSAENSRNAVVNELVSLRERFVVSFEIQRKIKIIFKALKSLPKKFVSHHILEGKNIKKKNWARFLQTF